MGDVNANIRALVVINNESSVAVDDFVIELPPGVLPDTLVAACQAIPGVKVLWVSRRHSDWSVASDIELLNRMVEQPARAGQLLTEGAPIVFHSTWAALLSTEAPIRVLAATDLAPDFETDGVSALGDLTRARSFELPAEWLPQWGEALIALAPLSRDRVIVLGRSGGPAYLDSELTRLQHLATLAG
jgi:hypothetical protein